MSGSALFVTLFFLLFYYLFPHFLSLLVCFSGLGQFLVSFLGGKLVRKTVSSFMSRWYRAFIGCGYLMFESGPSLVIE